MAKKENNKNKKSFFKDFKAELKKVIWPTPKQLINSTVAVITIVLITAAIVFVLDLTFEAINNKGINKLKEVVNTNESEVEETDNTDSIVLENPLEEVDENTSNSEGAI